MDCLAITKLDVLDEFEEIKSVLPTKSTVNAAKNFPSNARRFARCRPIYKPCRVATINGSLPLP
jgi:adenylosuccinate synthase